jgi:hypothetical protein
MPLVPANDAVAGQVRFWSSASISGQSRSVIANAGWIHVGSEQADLRVATIMSIIETCRRLQIPVREYLSVVLPGLENFPAKLSRN